MEKMHFYQDDEFLRELSRIFKSDEVISCAHFAMYLLITVANQEASEYDLDTTNSPSAVNSKIKVRQKSKLTFL